MRVLAIIFGIILLLPGLCAIGFMGVMIPTSGNAVEPLVPLWIVCFAISAGGIFAIRAGLRQGRPPTGRDR
jgi:hypothetical protein